MKRRTRLIWAALATLPLVLLVLWVSLPAQGSPGVPQPPVVVFTENFENTATPATAVFLNTYTGAPPQSMTYTAHAAWINGPLCNGLIGSFNSTQGATGCSASVYNTYIRPVARALGNAFGGGDDNQVMADVTAGTTNAATPNATFQTVSAVPLPSANRFIAFSIDVGVTSCAAPADPLLRFFLVDGATQISVNTAAINPCTAPGGVVVAGGNGGIRIGSFATDGAILFAGNAVGIKLTNDQTGGSGNDYSVDNIRLLDATPQLDKSFTDALVAVGDSTTLTFTITNTSELAAKPGWSFMDVLPAALTVANPALAATTCSSGIINAPAGGSSIQVTGSLLTGQTSCTASVRVTSAQAGTYTNGPANITQIVGLDAPGSDDVEFIGTPGIALIKTGSGPDPLIVGSTLNYSFLVTNTGGSILSNVVVTDALPGLSPISCPGTTLVAGANMTCTASYQITQADVDTGRLLNTATVTANPILGPPVSDSSSAAFPPLQAPGVSLQKTGSGPTPLTVGSTVTYTFFVANLGNVTLSNVAVADALPGLSAISCPGTTLAPAADMTCTASYTVTQANVNAGVIQNTASVSAAPPNAPVVSDQDSDTLQVAAPVPAVPITVLILLIGLLGALAMWRLQRSYTTRQ